MHYSKIFVYCICIENLSAGEDVISSILGNKTIKQQSTDNGSNQPFKFSYDDTYVKVKDGGWARQITNKHLSRSVEIAGVNMKLFKGAYRELHWHKEAEWSYILDGKCKTTVFDPQGNISVNYLAKGDIWFFPSGFPHSIQGLEDNGCEFLLIFDSGDFSEDSTFLLTDWLVHTPRNILSKNFNGTDVSFVKSFPNTGKFIFPGKITDDKDFPTNNSYVYNLKLQPPKIFPGGEVKIVDVNNFPISTTVSFAHVIIKKNSIRELHWHPNVDEWTVFIKGTSMMTIFEAEGIARTDIYTSGSVAVVPKDMGHYIENVGDEEVELLEIFRSPYYSEFSLGQWLANLPKQMVIDHLNLNDTNFLLSLNKNKIPLKKEL